MTGTFVQPNFETQTGTLYKQSLDNSIAVMARLAAAFAPHEQDTPNMTVRVNAGDLWVQNALVQKVAQNSATITAPTGTDHRIDRIVINAITGAVSVITGTPGASPTAPAITTGKLPICQVALAHEMTVITNDLITDERVGGGGGAGEVYKVGDIYSTMIAYADSAAVAAALGYGTWQVMGMDLYTKLLLHCNGTTTTFVDNSSTTKTVTPYGNATQSATQSKFGGKSAYFDGAGDYLIVSDHADFDFGTGNFTVDFWMRLDTVGGINRLLSVGPYSGAGFSLIFYGAIKKLSIWTGNAGVLEAAWDPAALTWYHVAMIRNGTDLRLYVDGVSIGSCVNSTNHATVDGVYIGLVTGDWDYGFKGYIDEFRISNGIARWTAAFTPPTVAYAHDFIDWFTRWARTA